MNALSFLIVYLQDHEKELRKKVVFWIENWADSTNGVRESIKSLLVYRDFSLWWFALPVLFPDVFRCIQYVEAIETLLKMTGAKEVIYVGQTEKRKFSLRLNRDLELPGKIIETVCKGLGLQVIKICGTGEVDLFLGYIIIK